jgi:hypothetical protein
MKSRAKPEAVDAYVAVLPRGYYEFTPPPPPSSTPAPMPVARDTRSRIAKIWRQLFGSGR